MSRLVVDAEGLIKLGKSGALAALARDHELLISAVVYEEAIVEGKKALYEDAFELEALLGCLEIEPMEDRRASEAERMLEEAGGSFGAGERAALRLYETSGADAVVLDDRTFTNFLARREIPVFAAVDALVTLVEQGHLGVEEGVECLERLRGYTRAPVFKSAMASIRAVEPASRDENTSKVSQSKREEGKDDH